MRYNAKLVSDKFLLVCIPGCRQDAARGSVLGHLAIGVDDRLQPLRHAPRQLLEEVRLHVQHPHHLNGMH